MEITQALFATYMCIIHTSQQQIFVEFKMLTHIFFTLELLMLLFVVEANIKMRSQFHPKLHHTINIHGGGVFFWYQAGVAKYLLEHFDLSKTNVLGTSAGALTATLLKTGSDFDLSARIAIELVNEKRLWTSSSGLKGVWSDIIDNWLQKLILSENLTPDVFSSLFIATTPVNIFEGIQILSNFESKADIIQACLSSAHIPYFMNNKLCSTYKDKYYIDGSFWPLVSFDKISPIKTYCKLTGISKNSDDQIWNLNYENDYEFCQKYSNVSFVSLLKPDVVYDMMSYGYNYCKKLD